MSDNIKECIAVIESLVGDIELISYGLAPNPFGFCYEVYTDVPTSKLHHLDLCLDSLSSDEEETIKDLYLR